MSDIEKDLEDILSGPGGPSEYGFRALVLRALLEIIQLLKSRSS